VSNSGGDPAYPGVTDRRGTPGPDATLNGTGNQHGR